MEIQNRLTATLDDVEQRALEEILSEVRGGRSIPPKLQEEIRRDGGTEPIQIVDTQRSSISRSHTIGFFKDPGCKWTVEIPMLAIRMRAAELELKEKRSQQLNAMFYPNAAIPEPALKLALLYFDKVCLLFPDEMVFCGSETDSHRQTPPMESALDRVAAFYRETEELRRARILNCLSPSENLPDAIFDAVQDDLRDQEYVQLVQSMRLPPMYVAHSKIGQSALRALRHYEQGAYSEAARSLSKARGPLTHDHSFASLPAELAMSALLNHALLLCSRHGLMPLSDRPSNEMLLRLKLSRQKGKEILDNFCSSHGIVSGVLAVKVLEQNIPLVNLRTYEDVLECREKLHDELGLFRVAMRRFAGAVSRYTDLIDLRGPVERIIDTEIAPALAELQSKLKLSKTNFFRRIFRDFKMGSVPIVASLFAGMPIPYLLGLSAGIITVDSLVESHAEKQRLKVEGNGLSYVIDCRRMLGQKRKWAF